MVRIRKVVSIFETPRLKLYQVSGTRTMVHLKQAALMTSGLKCFVSSVPRLGIELHFDYLSVIVLLGKLIEETSTSEVGLQQSLKT